MGGTNGGSGGGGGGGGGNDYYEELKEYAKYYDPDDDGERCVKGVVEVKCELPSGDVWYNPLEKFCDEIDYDDNTGISTIGLGEWKTCGSKHYVTLYERCQGSVIQWECNNGEWYNPNTEYCDYIYDPMNYTSKYEVKAKERCGNKYYEPGYEVCQGGVVGDMCGYGENAIFYNYETHYCDGVYDMETFSMTYTVKPMVRCGNEYIDPRYRRCKKNGVVERRCWSDIKDEYTDNWYNRITQSCNSETGEVKDRKKCV